MRVGKDTRDQFHGRTERDRVASMVTKDQSPTVIGRGRVYMLIMVRIRSGKGLASFNAMDALSFSLLMATAVVNGLIITSGRYLEEM